MISTPDLNIAAYLKEVKGIPVAKSSFRGRQLLIHFEMSQPEFDQARQDYMNSNHARCDAARQNFLQILKDQRHERNA